MFGLGRKKEKVEAMLAEAAAAGVALRPGTPIERVWAEWGRDEIEKRGFEMLLVALGGEQLDQGTLQPLEPLSDDVWHFDSECIEDHGSYARIVHNCCRISGGELKFDRVSDYVDVEVGIAWVELESAGSTQRVELRVKNDWVDQKIFDEMNRALGDGYRQITMHALGQDCLLLCKSLSQTVDINRKLGLRFGELRM
jgi:hypothetical protein